MNETRDTRDTLQNINEGQMFGQNSFSSGGKFLNNLDTNESHNKQNSEVFKKINTDSTIEH